MKKIFWILGIGLLVLIIIAAVIGIFYIGPIIKISMEQVGPQVTHVTVKVDAVDVSLLSGSANIKGLVIGNPQGYTAPQAISVGTVALSIDPMSVMSNKIMVHSIQVVSPEITFEGGVGGNNLSAILNNVKSVAPNDSNAASNTSGSTNNKPAPKIEVDDFLITGAKVHVTISGLGNKDIALPDIHLTDLGKGSDGLTPAELTSAVLSAISSDTLKAVTASFGNLGQGLKSLGVNTGNTVNEKIKNIATSFGGLLGK